MFRRVQNPRRFAITPARRGATAEDDSASEGDEHGRRPPQQQDAATAETKPAARSRMAVSNTESQQSLFGQLELEPQRQQQNEEHPEARERPPGREQQTHEVGFYYTLYSDGEHANAQADSDDNNEEGEKDTRGDTTRLADILPPLSTRKTGQLRQRQQIETLGTRSSGRKQSQSVASVVRSVSAAIAGAKSKPTATTRPETRAATRQQKEQDADEEQRQETQSGREKGEKQKGQDAPLLPQNPAADTNQQEQDPAAEEMEEYEIGRIEDDDSEIQMEEQPRRRRLPTGQGKSAKRSRQSRRQWRVLQSDGSEAEITDVDAIRHSHQDSGADRDPDFEPAQSEESTHSQRPKLTRMVTRRAAKRRRVQSQPATEAVISDMVEEDEAVQETTGGREAAADSDQATQLVPSAVRGRPSNKMTASTKTISAIVHLMGRSGWTGIQTWKMYLFRSKRFFMEAVTEEGQHLCEELYTLLNAYSEAVDSEDFALMDNPSGITFEEYRAQQMDIAYSTACDLCIFLRVVCNEKLSPYSTYAVEKRHRMTWRSARYREILVEDLLTFVIPHVVATLEAVYAIGGREPDKQLPAWGEFVPCETVQLDDDLCWHIRTIAEWLIQLENALALELGYRAPRNYMGRYSHLDEDDGGGPCVDDYRPGHVRQAGRSSQARYEGVGRRKWSRPRGPVNRPLRRSMASAAPAKDDSPYASTPQAKSRDRSRLKPLLNQLQDEVCRLCYLKSRDQGPEISAPPTLSGPASAPAPAPEPASTSAPAATPTPAAAFDDAEDIGIADVAELPTAPVDTHAGGSPRSRGQVIASTRFGGILEVVLPRTTLKKPAAAAQTRRGERGESEFSDSSSESEDSEDGEAGKDNEEDDGQHELPTPLKDVGLQQDNLPAENFDVGDEEMAEMPAAENDLGADDMDFEAYEQRVYIEPPAQTSPMQPSRPVPTLHAATPPAPTRAALSVSSKSNSPSTVESSPVRAPLRATLTRTPVNRNALSAETSKAPAAATATTSTDEQRAYTSAELKLILNRLRRSKDTARPDLGRLAADLGRDVYDVASRAEGIKSVVRMTAVREQKPVPRWAQAGYVI
ncbi:hypothetical protein SEPCBS119000_003991 [Sporothrix epigloea]|uniref:Uncharacterized protein n=1 Tax=Sporothrix epigloea TaxID=1892477 RepID=A0ABP0DPP2_9PEZI